MRELREPYLAFVGSDSKEEPTRLSNAKGVGKRVPRLVVEQGEYRAERRPSRLTTTVVRLDER